MKRESKRITRYEEQSVFPEDILENNVFSCRVDFGGKFKRRRFQFKEDRRFKIVTSARASQTTQCMHHIRTK